MASTYLELPLRSVGSLSAPGIASEATQALILDQLELVAKLTDTQPVSLAASPSQMQIQIDGVDSFVGVDTVTPSNTVRVPVEVYSAAGPINITAGDINMQLSDSGANPDIVKVGNGTNRLDINASNEALVHDTDVLAKLTDIESIDFATEAKQDSAITQLTSIAGKDFATQTTLAALLTELLLKAKLTDTQPVSIASMPSTPVTGTFWQATQPVSGPATDAELRATPLPVSGTVTALSPAQAGSFDEDATLSTTPETLTAPAGAFACFVEADETNTTNIRVKMGAAASTTSGIQFQPGRSEFYQGGSNISVCMESGTGKVSVQWFTR